MDARAPAISVDSVSVDFGKVRAVDKVSFEIAQGERLVLMGRSGCGKSTLLKAVGGFIAPSEGVVLVAGRKAKSPGPDRMVVWQDDQQLFPWKTIESNVAYPMELAGVPKGEARSRALQWLDRVGLTRALGHFPHQLSGGMRQRVSIARGFAANPAVLLMDEPFSALDALTRSKLQDELIKLQESAGTSVLFVSHDVAEAARVGCRVIVLEPHPGRVKAVVKGGVEGAERAIRDLIYETEPPAEELEGEDHA
jgi:NitT/TauT family transport system ATP-binding protein